MKKLFLFLIFLTFSKLTFAEERFFKFNLSRGAQLPVYEMSQVAGIATLILLPGGDAGTGKIIEDKPMSGNFLSRSRDLFYKEGFNILVMYRASDLNTMDYSYRVSGDHIKEIEELVNYAKKKFNKPVWLVGTSRGTVSGTAASIALGKELVSGLILTSSVTSKKVGAIGTQKLDSIMSPVLVVHHANDSCKICVPWEASQIKNQLKSSPYKKYIELTGGHSPEGNPCEAKHWHGFINYESETIKLIADWIKNPSN